MRYLAAILVVAFTLALLSGCGGSMAYITPVRPPMGILVTHYSAPLSTDFEDTPVCTKEGRASTFYVRDPLFTGLDFAWDNADIETAMSNGGLSVVEYADYRYTQVLFIFGKFTVVAKGR